MLFDTHSSVEHLAMMEVKLNFFGKNFNSQFHIQRVLGPLPVKMVERSKLKYFSKASLVSNRICIWQNTKNPSVQGKLKWDEDSSAGRHVRRKVLP